MDRKNFRGIHWIKTLGEQVSGMYYKERFVFNYILGFLSSVMIIFRLNSSFFSWNVLLLLDGVWLARGRTCWSC